MSLLRPALVVVSLVAGGALSGCGGDEEASGPVSTEPDHIAMITADTFPSLCFGPINDTLRDLAPDVWAALFEEPGEAASKVNVNVDPDDGDVDCVWDGPDGTSLYASFSPMGAHSERLSEDHYIPSEDLAAGAGTTKAYAIDREENDGYGAVWISGDASFSIYTEKVTGAPVLSTDDLNAIAQSLPAAGGTDSETGTDTDDSTQ